MVRKLSLAAAAAIALGTAALAPTSASAWWCGHHPYWRHGWWGGPHYYDGGYGYGYGNYGYGNYGYGGYGYSGYGYGCRRWVPTPWGPRLRWVC